MPHPEERAQVARLDLGSARRASSSIGLYPRHRWPTATHLRYGTAYFAP